MKTAFNLLLLFISSVSIAQQNKLFTKENFPEQKDELNQAIASIEVGNDYFDLGQRYYKLASLEYLKAYDFNSEEAELNYKLGLCYLSNKSEQRKATNFFKKAKYLKKDINPSIDLLMGNAYQIRQEFDSAIVFYKMHLERIGNRNQAETDKTERYIKECKFGKEQLSNPKRVSIKNVGINVNSKYPDYDPIISSDNTVLLFTSRRKGVGGEIDGELNEYFEDIWMSRKVNGIWQKAENIGEPINTKLHDAVVGLSPDGQRLLTYRGGDLYQSFLEGLEWSKPKKLVKTINSDAHESSASFSFNDQQLYFISERGGGQGKKDIWMSSWDEENWRWGEPTNLGATINTSLNEETVFAHPDGKTLYFSSEGHLGMGSYDIFKTVVQEDGSWGEPQNLGYPINSAGEDVSFVLAADGTHGYYSSVNENSIGERDIFEITFLPSEKVSSDGLNNDSLIAIDNSQLVFSNASIFKGVVLDEVSAKPIASKIEIYDNATGKLVLKSKSNSVTGKFLMALPANSNYNIAIKAEGYLFHSENFFIPEGGNYEEVIKNISLKPLKVGSAIVLNNIFFDHNKSTLEDASEVELHNILELMKNNKNLRIEVSGHTDDSGAESYNQKLSEDRAKAVFDHLRNHGIEMVRMSYKGYGESKPLASNLTEEGQSLNRRTEIKVTAF